MTAKIAQSAIQSQKWELKPLLEKDGNVYFSADQVIDAYFHGKKVQKNEHEKILLEKLESNLTKAKGITEKFFSLINDKGFHCSKALLRLSNITNINTLFIINEDDFIADKFLEIYELSINEKKKVNDNTFNYSMIFMPISDHVDEHALLSDGYILAYVGK